MWDYDKLFVEGNIVGIKNCYRNKVFNSVIDESEGTSWFVGYKNNSLSSKNQRVDIDNNIGSGYTTDFEIQYIIRLDDKGNVVERVFDREKDMPKPMPELETGMFVKCYSSYRNESSLGMIYSNHVVYQNGGWDYISDLTEDVIVEVYSTEALCFNGCQDPHLIWRNPKYAVKGKNNGMA